MTLEKYFQGIIPYLKPGIINSTVQFSLVLSILDLDPISQVCVAILPLLEPTLHALYNNSCDVISPALFVPCDLFNDLYDSRCSLGNFVTG